MGNIASILGLRRPSDKPTVILAPEEGDIVTYTEDHANHAALGVNYQEQYQEGELFRVREVRWYHDELIMRCYNQEGAVLSWVPYDALVPYEGDPGDFDIPTAPPNEQYRHLGPVITSVTDEDIGELVRYVGPQAGNPEPWGDRDRLELGVVYEITEYSGNDVRVSGHRARNTFYVPIRCFQTAGREYSYLDLRTRMQRRGAPTRVFWHDSEDSSEVYFWRGGDASSPCYWDNTRKVWYPHARVVSFHPDTIVRVPMISNSRFLTFD